MIDLIERQRRLACEQLMDHGGLGRGHWLATTTMHEHWLVAAAAGDPEMPVDAAIDHRGREAALVEAEIAHIAVAAADMPVGGPNSGMTVPRGGSRPTRCQA